MGNMYKAEHTDHNQPNSVNNSFFFIYYFLAYKKSLKVVLLPKTRRIDIWARKPYILLA